MKKPSYEHSVCGAEPELDVDYDAFVESVTVSREEMAVLISKPDVSCIKEAKECLRAAKGSRLPRSTEGRIHFGIEQAVARVYARLANTLTRCHFGNHGHHHG